MTTTLNQAAADPQQTIAELRRQLDESLAQRNSEYGERIEHQSATIEVLKVMSVSPGDAQPVFDLIVQRAQYLCNANAAALYGFDGELLHLFALRWAATPPEAAAAYERHFPMAPTRGSSVGRAILDRQIVHIQDADSDPDIAAFVRDLGVKTIVGLPLLRDGAVIGAISLNATEPGGFSASQVALLRTFAEQAVIAITSAESYRELGRRTADLQESLEYQTATSEVLQAISRSTFDLDIILQTVVSSAHRLCRADQAVIFRYEGGEYRWAAGHEMAAGSAESERNAVILPGRGTLIGRAVLAGSPVQIEDAWADPEYASKDDARAAGTRAMLGVPLLREGTPIGAIGLARNRVEPFSERETQLVATFADQAAIAIENARLIGELQARTDDLQESLEYQTATSDVLKVISRSTFDLQRVLETLAESAANLAQANSAYVFRREGEACRLVAGFAESSGLQELIDTLTVIPDRGTATGRVLLTGQIVHIPDVLADPEYTARDLATAGGYRTTLAVPLLRDETAVGSFALTRPNVDPFTPRQIELIRTFADQAVIAMENARLITETREALDQQTATAEVLQVINSSPGDLAPVFDAMLEWARGLCGAAFGTFMLRDGDRFSAAAVHGAVPPPFAAIVRKGFVPSPSSPIGRLREGEPFVHIADLVAAVSLVTDDPVPRQAVELGGIRTLLMVPLIKDGQLLGVFTNFRQEVRPFTDKQVSLLQNFAAQAVIAMENARLITETRAARDAAEAALRDLRAAQANLIQAEKMASLGQLTAGIAHEIKNPLNFVNNFASLSVELLDELKEATEPAVAALGDDKRAEVNETMVMLTGNLEKIAEHGKRADNIVKSMLEHSRGVSGERREVDLNGLVEEALNLAYHGARAQDRTFNITLERDYAASIKPIELAPQEITRVFFNLFGNGFYAANKRSHENGGGSFRPTLTVATRDDRDAVEVRVRDNGIGIPPDIREKLFQPFFTTKPTGEGTGLGLSISYDIVTQQHGGSITVDSRVGEFTEFTVRLPRAYRATTAEAAA